MKTFILLAVIPAFIAFLGFSECNSAFADAHHLHSAYVTIGWLFAVWTVGYLGVRFATKKR